MTLENMNNLDLNKTITNFLEGKVNEDLFIDFSRALDEKYSSFDDLIPLLESKHKFAQLAAVFIASFEGEEACVIFDYVKPLINSHYWEVQEEACDCFISCGENEDLKLLVSLLEDSEIKVRLKVIQVFISIGYQKLMGLLDYLSIENKEVKTLLKSVESFNINEGVVNKNFDSIDLSNSFNSVFAYVLGVFEFTNIQKLEELVNYTENGDLQRFHEIYFMKDPDDDSCIPWNITSFSKST